MIQLKPFTTGEFDTFISWIDSRELLLTIAGTVLIYPVTHEQLQAYLDDPKSHSFNIVETDKVIGHAEIVLGEEGSCKIDKLIVGDQSQRGKGTGQKVIQLLLQYAFEKLNMQMAELNVFNWNAGAIKCYTKCGFTINPVKQAVFKNEDDIWIALNMTIDRVKWQTADPGLI